MPRPCRADTPLRALRFMRISTWWYVWRLDIAVLHRNETTCEVVNPRFRNLDCKTNEFGMPRVERWSLATSSCSGSSRPFGVCRGTRQQITFISEHRRGLATVTSIASLQQSYS